MLRSSSPWPSRACAPALLAAELALLGEGRRFLRVADPDRVVIPERHSRRIVAGRLLDRGNSVDQLGGRVELTFVADSDPARPSGRRPERSQPIRSLAIVLAMRALAVRAPTWRNRRRGRARLLASTTTAPIPSSIPAEARPSRANRDGGAGRVPVDVWVVGVRWPAVAGETACARWPRHRAYRDRNFRSLVIVTRLPSTLDARIRECAARDAHRAFALSREAVGSVDCSSVDSSASDSSSVCFLGIRFLVCRLHGNLESPVRGGRLLWPSPRRSPPATPRRVPTAAGSNRVRPEPCRRFRHRN